MRRVIDVIFFVDWIVIVAFILHVRFTNIDMTEARLLTTYWKTWVMIVVWAIVFFLYYVRIREKG